MNIMNALHAFFTWLYQKGIVKGMPAFPTVKGDDATPRVSLDYDDQQVFLDNVPVAHRDVLEFGFETGLRPGELCALKIFDFDLRVEKGVIQRTLSCGTVRETTKAKNKRPIPLSDRAIELIRTHSEGRFGADYLFINPVQAEGIAPSI